MWALKGHLVKEAGMYLLAADEVVVSKAGKATHGMINVIVRPQVHERCHEIMVNSPLLVVSGVLQHQGEVVNVIATNAVPLN